MLEEKLFSETQDYDRNTIPGYVPPLFFEVGQKPPPYQTPAQARIKMFPDGEYPRPLSTASSVATYEGSERDPDYIDVRDEIDTDEFKRDREEVANWLLCSDPLLWHSPHANDTMVTPFTLPHVAGSLLLQLFHALLLYFNFLPMHKQYSMPIPSRFQRPKDPDEKPDPLIKDKDNSLMYIISIPPRRFFPILVTRDWSYDNMKYQPKNSVRIYRVLEEDYYDFIARVQNHSLHQAADIRRPVDEFDCVSLMRHGQPSMDIGSGDEQWHLVSANPGLIEEVMKRLRRHKIPFRQRLIRFLRRLWPWRRDKRTYVKKNRFYGFGGFRR